MHWALATTPPTIYSNAGWAEYIDELIPIHDSEQYSSHRYWVALRFRQELGYVMIDLLEISERRETGDGDALCTQTVPVRSGIAD